MHRGWPPNSSLPHLRLPSQMCVGEHVRACACVCSHHSLSAHMSSPSPPSSLPFWSLRHSRPLFPPSPSQRQTKQRKKPSKNGARARSRPRAFSHRLPRLPSPAMDGAIHAYVRVCVSVSVCTAALISSNPLSPLSRCFKIEQHRHHHHPSFPSSPHRYKTHTHACSHPSVEARSGRQEGRSIKSPLRGAFGHPVERAC